MLTSTSIGIGTSIPTLQDGKYGENPRAILDENAEFLFTEDNKKIQTETY